MRRPFTSGAVIAAFCAAAVATAQTLPAETDRIIATGKLWFTVKYFHPSLPGRSLNWDQSVADVLPKVRAAQTPAAYESAIRSLMHGLEVEPNPSASGQRARLYHGFPPETGVPSQRFYSAILYKPGAVPDVANVPMSGFTVDVPLSEPSTGPPQTVPTPAAVAAPQPFPSVEYRILAACKIWGVIHYFYAYRDLLDEDWDALLPQFLPRLIAAKDEREYNLAIAEWLTHLADSNVAIDSLTAYFGEAPVGLRLQVVEKHVVVTEVLDPAATKAGIKVGDVVKKVDGETLVDRFKRQAQFVPASTPQRLAFDVVQRLLNGPDGSAAVLTLEDFAGNRKEATLTRGKNFAALLAAQPLAGEAVKLLRAGIGYVDLRRLKTADVDAMFEKTRNAPAIVFDMRGLPLEDSIRAIASRLTSQPEVPGAIVTGPIIAVPDWPQGLIANPSSTYFFLETVGTTALPKYQGRTVMLVDERTIGLGEEAGLFFEAANKTEFIGTPSAGAHSVLTNFTLPGGVTISFSGEDIRHSNGGKLQRLGLQPNLNAAPTLSGIRTGKDEVLEKALDYLSPSPKVLPSRALLSHP